MATRNSSAQQDEPEPTNKELMEMSSQLQRAVFLRRLNSLQASTRVFPPETLSLIFQHFYHSHSSRFHVGPELTLKLGHVSSYWRQIVWSTPQLWSNLDLVARGGNTHAVAALLQLFLRNVGGLPLNVHLTFRELSRSVDRSLDSILSVLFHENNAAKIQSLDLDGVPRELATWFAGGNFSLLKCLSLGFFQCQDSDVLDLDLAEAPCLHDVSLSYLYVPMAIERCWSNVASLHLQQVLIDTCVKLLTNCPNLVEFYCLEPEDPPDDVDTTSSHHPHNTTTLNRLETFVWNHHDDRCCRKAFKHLRFPALRELTWCSGLDPRREERTVRKLISNLPPTLSSLRLHYSNWTIPLLKDTFKQTSHVEHLSLGGCSKSAIANVFSILTEDADADDRPMLLPSLKTVVIVSGVKEEVEVDLSLLILRFLQDRFRRGYIKFRLEFQLFLLEWPIGVQEELCRMRKEGFKLEIYDEYSEKPDWLEAAEGLTT